MIRTAVMLLVTLALTASSLAQNLGGNVTGTFIAEDVQTHQGKITIDPASTTVLRFFDAITFAFSRRSDILKAVPKGNDLVLYAMTEKAETDLSVLCDGKWHFFSVRIAKGTGLRFYEVKPRSEPALTPSLSPASQPSIAPSSTSPASSALPSPQGLKFDVRLAQTSSQEQRLTYTLENAGTQRIVADERQLRVLRDGKALEFTVENSGKLILEPGGLFTGIIRVKAPAGALSLQWALRGFGSRATYTVGADLK